MLKEREEENQIMLQWNSDVSSESEATLKFLNSLKELRELRSQIHSAADYCESAFKQAQDKNMVMDNTREYICKAAVTVVDHLGCVSANLDSRIKESNRISEAELRINCIKQKVVLHGEYNQTLVLSRLSRRALLPRHFSRYILPPTVSNQVKPEEQSSCRQFESGDDEADTIIKKQDEHKIEEELPLFMYTDTNTSKRYNNYDIPLYRSPSMSVAEFNTLESLAQVLPVQDGLSNPQETKRAAFHFQMARKHGRRILQWRIQDKEILSLIRRSKGSLKFLKS